MKDEVIHHYVEGINFDQDAIFGVFDADLKFIGLAYLAYLPEIKSQARAAEFGVSVLPKGQYQGLGSALLQRSAVHSRNSNIQTL